MERVPLTSRVSEVGGDIGVGRGGAKTVDVGVVLHTAQRGSDEDRFNRQREQENIRIVLVVLARKSSVQNIRQFPVTNT